MGYNTYDTTYGVITLPNANIQTKPNQDNGNRINFNGKVTAAQFNVGVASSSMRGALCFAVMSNAVDTVEAPYADISSLTDDTFLPTTQFRFGYAEISRAQWHLNGHSQMIDRFVKGGTCNGTPRMRVRSSSGTPTITMKGSGDSVCEATFEDAISLVWDPLGAYTMTCQASREHTTAGSITVKGGTFAVTTATTFKNLSAITVSNTASFLLNTTGSGALTALSSLTLGASASFTVAATATTPFTDDSVAFDLAGDATLTLPEGLSFKAASFRVGGANVVSPGAYFTGSDNDNPGTATKLGVLRGKGLVYIPVQAAEEHTATWNGQGSDEHLDTPANWKGGETPDLAGNTLAATFAEGGTQAVVTADAVLRGIVFDATNDFTLASANDAKIVLGGDSLSATAPGDGTDVTYRVTAPLQIAAAQEWTVAHTNAHLEVLGPLSHGEYSYPITVSGVGSVKLAGTNTVYDNAVYLRGCSVTLSGRNPAGVGLLDFRGDMGTLKLQDADIDGDVLFKDYAAFNRLFVVGSNTVHGSMTVSGTHRPVLTGTLVVEGGLQSDNYWIPTHGNGTVIVKNKPFRGVILQLDWDANMRLATTNNFASTRIIPNGFGTLHLDVDWAIDATNQTVILASWSRLSLHGHDQRIGTLRPENPHSGNNGWIDSDSGPATLEFWQHEDFVWGESPTKYRQLTGQVSLSKYGPKTMTVNCPLAATGTLAVAEGTFAFTSAGSWTNATNVVVRGTGTLSLAGSTSLGAETAVIVDEGGMIHLADGVRQVVGTLDYGQKRRLPGLWGSSSSMADHKDDLHFSGTGVLEVKHGDGGLVIVIR